MDWTMPLTSRFSFWSMMSSSLSTQEAFPIFVVIFQSNDLQAQRDHQQHVCFCSWISLSFRKVCIESYRHPCRISCFPYSQMETHPRLPFHGYGTSSSSSSS